jgi:enoyl-CoA hydratase/carnithine racemase
VSVQELIIERADRVAVLTLNAPERLNALTTEPFDDLADSWRSLEGDKSVRAVVLTTAGRALCAGAHVKGLADAASRPADDQADSYPLFTVRHLGFYKPAITP